MPVKKIPILVKTFEEFAIFCKNKWRATTLAIFFIAIIGFVALSLFYGYKRIDTIGTIVEESHTSTEELQVDFAESVESNRLIEKEMTKCVFQHDASAMLVFKFHNSRTDLQGKHDFFYSATNEVSNIGVYSYLPDAQAIPIVRLGRYITPMLEGKCQVVHIASMPDNDWLKGKLQLQKIETLVACPIYSEGNLLGFAELVYSAENPAPVDDEIFPEILNDFLETTKHIAIILEK